MSEMQTILDGFKNRNIIKCEKSEDERIEYSNNIYDSKHIKILITLRKFTETRSAGFYGHLLYNGLEMPILEYTSDDAVAFFPDTNGFPCIKRNIKRMILWFWNKIVPIMIKRIPKLDKLLLKETIFGKFYLDGKFYVAQTNKIPMRKHRVKWDEINEKIVVFHGDCIEIHNLSKLFIPRYLIGIEAYIFFN